MKNKIFLKWSCIKRSNCSNLNYASWFKINVTSWIIWTYLRLNVSRPLLSLMRRIEKGWHKQRTILIYTFQNTRLPRNYRKLNFIEENGDYPTMNRRSYEDAQVLRVASMCCWSPDKLKLSRNWNVTSSRLYRRFDHSLGFLSNVSLQRSVVQFRPAIRYPPFS